MAKKTNNKIRYVLVFTFTVLAIIIVLNNAVKIIYPIKFKEYVYKYSHEYKVDPYLVFAVIKAESSFNPNAISHRNARGLMQISEVTGDWAAKSLGLEEFKFEKLFDPETNIRIGCWYLNILIKEFNNDIDLVIAAYNGGSGNVSEWLKDKSYSNSGKNLEKIPFRETEMFLEKVKNYYDVYKKLYEKSN